MVVGLGIDLLEHRTLERELARGAWQARDGVFTPSEIQAWNGAARPAVALALCFAVKEATLKALGLGIRDIGSLSEVEFRGAREVVLHGRVRAAAARLRVRKVWTSTARTALRSGAIVILET